MEDLVIHKSMKSFVDTTSIIRADKNNCYSKFTPGDSFLSAKTDVTNYCADIIYYILSENSKNIHLNFNSRWMFLFLISSDLSDFTML